MKKIKCAITISTEGVFDIVDAPEGAYQLFEFLQKLVGGFFEIVRPCREYEKIIGNDRFMVLNENGIREGKKFNPAATLIYGGSSPIVGNVAIVGSIPGDVALFPSRRYAIENIVFPLKKYIPAVSLLHFV